MTVDYFKYKNEDFTCENCGWQGKGSELVNGEFSEVHFICDLDCPQCNEMVDHWQAPLLRDMKNKSKD